MLNQYQIIRSGNESELFTKLVYVDAVLQCPRPTPALIDRLSVRYQPDSERGRGGPEASEIIELQEFHTQ